MTDKASLTHRTGSRKADWARSPSTLQMDFQRQLLHIEQSLGTEDVEALVFLCTKVSRRSLNSVELFKDLCNSLSEQELLSPERPQLLKELLLTIHRPLLARNLQRDDWGPTTPLISQYRKLLYSLSEDITDEDLKNIKFLLNQKLPRRKLDESVTTLKLFLEMEQMDLLSESNFDLLHDIFESVCPVLNEKINRYKEQAPPAVVEAPVTVPMDEFQQPLNVRPQSPRGANHVPGLQLPGVSLDVPQDPGVTQQQVGNPKIGTNLPSIKDLRKTSLVNNVYNGVTNEEIGTYPMTGVRRGICSIVNNYKFSGKKLREGTQIDQECLEQVFRWLGFEVEVHPDCSSKKMVSVMEELSRRDHSDMDCVVCCFLSHGFEGGIYGVDDKSVHIEQLKMFFNGSKCPSLVDKPKLFFIQACQGLLEQQAVNLQTDGPSCIESDAAKVDVSIPSGADFLLGMATVPSYVSYREKSSGSWFIQALCKNLIQMVPRGEDLVSILTKVNADDQCPVTVCADTSLMLRGGTEKTPIQILHEYGTKTGDLPVYLLEKSEGEAHQPSFVFSVQVGEVSCTGQGSSKKAAKHQAAEAALKILQIDGRAQNIPVKSESNGVAADTSNSEIALQRGWRLPEYTVMMEAGPPHKREFTVTCRMESLTEKAIGNTKKSAKKAAAEKLMAKLQSLSDSSEITWTLKSSIRLDNLRISTAEKISLLRRNPLSIPNTDYIQMMLDLSKEQGFEVTYFDIDELTVNGQYQCLAELSTSPVTVCHGTGISCSNAHNDAAHNALQYIKIMASSK
uniref:Caspase-8 n=1 Tax=Knipowitschia caucasica TaxID=637954 RepID=A0AAV2K3T1_KNICA